MTTTLSEELGVDVKLEELGRLLLKVDQVPSNIIKKASRLIRFSTSTSISQLESHHRAVKQKIREKILSKYDSSQGPIIVAKFERDCDILRRKFPSTLISWLPLLEGLMEQSLIVSKSPFGGSVPEQLNVLKRSESSITLTQSLSKSIPVASLPVDSPEDIHFVFESGIFWIKRDMELKIIADLLFIFQGINGKYIKYDPRSESYVIDPSLKPSPPASVRDIIFCLCEVGWLYHKVSTYVQRMENSDSVGLIAQSFTFALNEELHDYYRLLAVLEQELHRLTNPSTLLKFGEDGATSGLTLLRLRAWMHEPLERLCLMARLVDSAQVLVGGALASRLHGHGRHGDELISSFVHRLMDRICVPLYNMLKRWIIYGELEDPYDEFFIATHRSASANVWSEMYYLRQGMLPSFLSLAVAMRILVIGKTINFVRACMSTQPRKLEKVSILPNTEFKPRNRRKLAGGGVEVDTSVDPDLSSWLISSLGQDIEISLQKLRYGGELELSEVVQKVSTLTDSKLMDLIDRRYFLKTHLLALKKFLLLGQGDFVTCLMDTLGPELRKRSNQLYRHNLTGMLEGALRSSNAQYEPQFVLDRIGVRLLESSPGDSGWEVFSLDYKVDSPLNAVVHNDAISKYRIAFHMFWRLKRVEWSLSASWKQMMTFTHTRGEVHLPRLRPVVHKCTLSRGQMMHVVNNLCAFIMFEVLESAWAKLQEKLSKAKCFDDMIRAHDSYLEEILDRALLSPQHEQLNLQIQQLLQSILRFCTLEEAFIADAMAALARRRGTEDKRLSSSAGSTKSAAIDDVAGSVHGVPGYVIQRLEDSIRDFNAHFDGVMVTLKEQTNQMSDLLRYLTFRLDFNEYHHMQQKQKIVTIGQQLPRFKG